jgi:hypothetical protein
VFCSADGISFSKETHHTEDEIWEILDAFSMILAPQSVELSEDELKEYRKFSPLAEYSDRYGIAVRLENHVELAVAPTQDKIAENMRDYWRHKADGAEGIDE